MNDVSTGALLLLLAGLIMLSGFFSSSETGMMSLNRYRLKHLSKHGHPGARRASKLLERTDQLIGVILVGNNFVNIFASAIATVIAIRVWGDAGIAIATTLLTIVILIFAEVTPKTLAANFPEKVAFPASLVLGPLLKLMYPLVWLLSQMTSGILRMLGIASSNNSEEHLSREELRTVVHEAGGLIPKQHKKMLISILDLEKVTVDDIMVPRNEIVGINLDDDIEQILTQLKSGQHTRMPLYKGDINNIIGVIHIRNLSRVLLHETPNKALLMKESRDPYFIPESTPLHTQLLNFQKNRRRLGIVVDEYGEVMGIATLEDILEEIVGEFTTDYAATSQDIIQQENGDVIVDGTTTVRYINKALGLRLPLDGPKTLNGLIMEHLQTIPESPVCLRLHSLNIEIQQVKDNIVKSAIVRFRR